MGSETDQLRMVPVALCVALQDFLGKQRLAPKGDEAFGIEIYWVQGPQPHQDNAVFYRKTSNSPFSPSWVNEAINLTNVHTYSVSAA